MEILRIHVERIVRPLRASMRRKNTMREELLGHLARKVQTALADGASEAEALEQAIADLGEPSTLRQELQASVPRIERLLYTRPPGSDFADAWFERWKGESAVGFASRRSAYTSLALPFALCGIIAVEKVMQNFGVIPTSPPHHNIGDAENVLLCGGLVALQAVVSFIAYYFADVSGLRDILTRANNARAWQKGIALTTFIVVYLALFQASAAAAVWVLSPERFTKITGLIYEKGLWMTLGCGMFLAVPVLGWAMAKEHEQYERWGRLRIDE